MSAEKDGAAIVGLGAAACAACCAGPIIGVLAALGLGAVAGMLLFGAIGLAVAAIVAAVVLTRRRRRRAACTPAPTSVAVEAPSLRG